MVSFALTLAFLFVVSVADTSVSACVGEISPLAQLIVQLILHVITTSTLVGLYMQTVLIVLPPSAIGIFAWLSITLNILRLVFLILVRVLAYNQVVNRINILFDIFNLMYWWCVFAGSLQLGKSKYYSFRFAFT